MNCRNCKYYEEGWMWNRCGVTEQEYFSTYEDCEWVDDNGEDNGSWDRMFEVAAPAGETE